MKRLLVLCFAVVFARCAIAEDISVADIPPNQIVRCLPDNWRVESIEPADTVAGWAKMSGSKGIRLEISRTPYDKILRRAKSGELAVDVPRFYLYVFPDDFVGRHVNGARVFKDGKVTEEKCPLLNRSMLIMEEFTQLGEWYVFHNNPTFQDWSTPTPDVIKTMTEIPNK